jgi:hypothetical protein
MEADLKKDRELFRNLQRKEYDMWLISNHFLREAKETGQACHRLS